MTGLENCKLTLLFMTFFLFSIFASSLDWYDFKIDEWRQLVTNSTEKPVFALMYATWCPDCHGKDEIFKKFYKKQKESLNMTFTLINCRDRRWCLRQGAYSIPYWFVMNGPDPFSWPHTNSPDPREWQKLVNQAEKQFLEKAAAKAEQKKDL